MLDEILQALHDEGVIRVSMEVVRRAGDTTTPALCHPGQHGSGLEECPDVCEETVSSGSAWKWCHRRPHPGQRRCVIRVSMEVVSLDSTMVKVHPDGTGSLKASGPQNIGKYRGGCTTKIHMIAVDDKTALAFQISPGQDHDAPVGRGLIRGLADGPEADRSGRRFLVMDRAYECDETRELAVETGFTPVVPPKTASTSGSTTKRYTNGAMKSSGCSDG